MLFTLVQNVLTVSVGVDLLVVHGLEIDSGDLCLDDLSLILLRLDLLLHPPSDQLLITLLHVG